MEASRNYTTNNLGHLSMPDSLLPPEQDTDGPDSGPTLHLSVRGQMLPGDNS